MPRDAATLIQKLQAIVDKHSSFWNNSFSFAIYNKSVDVAVATGRNDYSDPSSKLTPENQIPLGSMTKMYTAVSVLRLAMRGQISGLDQPVAPLIDRYLARPLNCTDAPPICLTQCAPFAHCYVEPSTGCDQLSKANKSTCSYCFRYLHCFSRQDNDVPATLTLRQIWDNDTTIEKVSLQYILPSVKA